MGNVNWFLALAGILLFFSAEAFVNIDVHKAKDLIHSSHRYIDVRTTEEFKKGHVDVEDIVNIPYMFITPEGRLKNPQFLEQISSAFSKDDHIVLGCQSGIRSALAATDLQSAGFMHVTNMEGGYAAWIENGFGVKKPQHQELKPQEELKPQHQELKPQEELKPQHQELKPQEELKRQEELR